MAGNPINAYTPVLALHCSLGSSAQWRSLARAMPERTVIATDLIGYGDAPLPADQEGFSLDHEVDAIERELRERGIGTHPLHIVGHSYGGAVAFRFALRNPDRVKSIALFEPVTIWLLRHDPEAAPIVTLATQSAQDLEAGFTMKAAQRFIDFWSGIGSFSALAADTQSALARRMGKVRLDFTACLSERSPLPAPGSRLQMPALLMNGTAAFGLIRANLRVLRRAFAECVTVEISGNHMAPVENRVQVDSAIAAFIRKSERQASTELKVA